MLFSGGTAAMLSVLFSCVCAVPFLRRALHMYQLSSYQNPSYRQWLGQNRREQLGAYKILLCAALAVCAYFYIWLACAALAVVANLPARSRKKAKKPLDYTSRVKRLLGTFAVLSLALCGAAFWLETTSGWNIAARCGAAALAAAFVFAQHWLVMLYKLVNSPLEKAVARRYINEARAILRGMPGLTVIGITGSYGKTSTKYFLNELLGTRHSVYMTPGNYNTTLGVVRAVREGLRSTHDIFLCEMGARHRGDVAEICELVRPQIGVLTYIGQQHMETFGSQQAITETKLELADAVQKVFVNADSEIAAQQQYVCERVLYGSDTAAEYRAADIETGPKGLEFTVRAPNGESHRFSTKLLGGANVQNLTGAIAVAHSMGIPLSALAPAVRALKSVPHRLEMKRLGGLTVIDDAYNSNPEGARIALETLSGCKGFRIAVTPGLVELGQAEREQNTALGRRAARCCDYLITVGQRPGALVAEGAKSAGMTEVFEARDINQAMEHVRALAREDKIVLLLNDLPDNY